jgi:hypothetical protein
VGAEIVDYGREELDCSNFSDSMNFREAESGPLRPHTWGKIFYLSLKGCLPKHYFFSFS